MGYNQTFEIIIKDIQDIEKLVGNFKNYSRVPKIEMDLALSKLRNVYDLMLLFRENDHEQPNHEQEIIFENEIKPPVHPQNPATDIPPPPPAPPVQERSREQEKESKPPAQERNQEPTVQETESERPAQEQKSNPPAQEARSEQPVQEQKPEAPGAGKHDLQEDPLQKSPDPSPEIKEAAHRQEEQIKREKILSEQYEKRKGYINEKLGEKNVRPDLSSKLQSSPIEKIAGSMGINDKFFFIRELFGGDAEKFRQTMDVLDHSADFDAAWNYLDKEFDWDMESSTVRQLLNLLRRKFISG